MRAPEAESPFNTLPPVIAALFLVIMGIEAVFSLGARGLLGGPEAIGWRISALQTYAFSPEVLGYMIETGRSPWVLLQRFVTYAFVHGNFTQALFAGVMLLALGKFVGEAMGTLRVLLVFVASTIGGALIFALLTSSSAPLFGAFPAVYGLIGAFTYLLWLRLGQMGAQQMRAFSLIGVLLGLQLIFGLLFGGDATWVADVGGFATGFVLTLVLVPGGWARLLDKMRGR